MTSQRYYFRIKTLDYKKGKAKMSYLRSLVVVLRGLAVVERRYLELC